MRIARSRTRPDPAHPIRSTRSADSGTTLRCATRHGRAHGGGVSYPSSAWKSRSFPATNPPRQVSHNSFTVSDSL